MALKSNREGLRRELVDYLGNIIVDGKLKQDIINANSIDLLWTNSNSSATFQAQTISLDLSSYKSVYIIFRAHAANSVLSNIYRSCICLKNTSISAPSSADAQYCRVFSVNDTGVTFNDGFYFTTYNTNAIQYENNIEIPVYIYGIK